MGSATAGPAFVVGAYAAMPSAPAEQEDFYRLLGEQTWIDGLELPFPGDLEARPDWVAGRLASGWRVNTVTAIPGTVARLGTNPLFGLASPDPGGRAEAIAFAERIREAVHRLADVTGHSVVGYVQLHSAPARIARPEHLLASLSELLDWDWAGASLVIEHCDQYMPGQKPEKGFLTLSDELDVAGEAGIGLHLNWGRSCIGARDAHAPAGDIAEARTRGLLTGVIFSGVSSSRSPYGSGWADAHLPAAPDEPTSLMGVRQIADCAAAAREPMLDGPPADYLGAKICVPQGSTLDERLAMIRSIHEASTSEL